MPIEYIIIMVVTGTLTFTLGVIVAGIMNPNIDAESQNIEIFERMQDQIGRLVIQAHDAESRESEAYKMLEIEKFKLREYETPRQSAIVSGKVLECIKKTATESNLIDVNACLELYDDLYLINYALIDCGIKNKIEELQSC